MWLASGARPFSFVESAPPTLFEQGLGALVCWLVHYL